MLQGAGVQHTFLDTSTVVIRRHVEGQPMPQSLIAILAMVVTSLFAFNQHKSVLNSRMGMIRQDVSMRATGVAVDVMEEIGAMAFDDATKTGPIADLSMLTYLPLTIDSVDVEQLESGGADDIDDFNGLTLGRIRTHGSQTMNFTARPRVNYVTGDGTTVVGYATKFKRVSISVVATDFVFPDTVRVSQVFACGTRCDW